MRVLVDDLPCPERPELLPAHGLSMLVELERGESRLRVLFDTGPSLEVLEWNARRLEEDPFDCDVVFLSLWHRHHVGGFIQAVRARGDLWEKTVAPSFPLGQASPARGTLPKGLRLVGPLDPWFGELALAARLEEGWVVFSGCCYYGVRRLLAGLSSLGRVYALVGGLNLSSLDVLDIPYLLDWAVKKGVQLVVPLHSVSAEAREIILARVGGGIDWSGVGLDVEL